MQAAIFDFDGIVYDINANWRILDSRAGVIGSYVSCLEACRIYDDIKKPEESLKITQFFSVEDLHYKRHPVSEKFNLLPPENIIQAARLHQQKGRRLMIFSARDYEGFDALMDRIYFEHQKRIGQNRPMQKANPFRSAEFIFPSVPVPSSLISAKDGVFLKTELIKNMLEYTDQEPVHRIHSDRLGNERFERVFYYHTQQEMGFSLDSFINNTHIHINGGKNSLIHYYIADPY